jgi:hypothetical protein
MASTTLLWIDNDSHDDVEVVTLDVHDAASQTVLASWTLHRNDFQSTGPGGVQAFDLLFTTPAAANPLLEYRVFYRCCSQVGVVAGGWERASRGHRPLSLPHPRSAQVTHVSTTVRELVDAGPMAAFWNGSSTRVSFVSNNTFPTPGNPAAFAVRAGPQPHARAPGDPALRHTALLRLDAPPPRSRPLYLPHGRIPPTPHLPPPPLPADERGVLLCAHAHGEATWTPGRGGGGRWRSIACETGGGCCHGAPDGLII